MTWRVHLSDSVVYRIDVLPGTPELLCVWFSNDEASFFDLASGAARGRLLVQVPDGDIDSDRGSEDWQQFLGGLRATNGAVLPVVRLPELTIHRTDDNRYRLYDDGHGLSLQVDGTEQHIGPVDKLFTSVKLDRTAGVAAALDERGLLHTSAGAQSVTSADVGLQLLPGILPDLAVADGAASIFLSDGSRIILTDRACNVRCAVPTHYPVGKIACSRNGHYCATSDSETGIIRVYTGEMLNFAYQKFAVDLFAAARPVQLLADMPTPRLGISALTITNNGVIAFAMDGMVTVTNLTAMQKMPHLQSG
ncbi:MAG: hypothetical protein AAF653_08065 [Chloroflexota bacterium]